MAWPFSVWDPVITALGFTEPEVGPRIVAHWSEILKVMGLPHAHRLLTAILAWSRFLFRATHAGGNGHVYAVGLATKAAEKKKKCPMIKLGDNKN